MATLSIANFDRFILRLDALLRRNDLLTPADPLDPLADVDRLVANAQRLKLASELEIARYAILASQFGDGLEAIRDRPWGSLLAFQGDECPEEWIERIFTLVVANLQTEGDPVDLAAAT